MQSSGEARATVAIAGQPNTGKSTLFNALTGLRQAVGNWPGKTVEKKSGAVWFGKDHLEMVDLPGTYSLTAGSAEERIARDFVLDGDVSLVLVVVNALCLERTLYYVSEVAALGVPYVVGLNMMDLAEEAGCLVDIGHLQEQLGVPVIPLVASKGTGVEKLKSILWSQAASPIANDAGLSIAWLDGEVKEIHESLGKFLGNGAGRGSRAAWEALKLMEGDADVRAMLQAEAETALQEADARLQGKDSLAEQLVAARYAWIRKVVGDTSPSRVAGERTHRWDRWATHPFWGLWIMVGVLLVSMIAGLAAGLSPAFILMEGVFRLEKVVFVIGSEYVPWLGGLLQGIVRGAGSVLAIVPFIGAFHAVFSLLEDVGYMARIAFVMDRFMAKIGLSGRAFIPFLFALPCNISGALACRITDSERQRFLTTMLVPLVPCSAKIAVSAAIAAWLFPPGIAVGAVVGLVFLNFLLLGFMCKLLDRFVLKDEEAISLIMELPQYQRPNWKAIARQTYVRCVAFVRKAGTVIVAFSTLIWFAAYFPSGEINTSLLGYVGHLLEPLGDLMGLDWRMMTALFASVLNKEAMLATLAVIFNVPTTDLSGAINASISGAGAITFIYAQSVFLPCVATLGIIYSETGKRVKTLLGILLYTSVLSLGLGILLYQVLHLLID
mgnify:CR=1 FL=1